MGLGLLRPRSCPRSFMGRDQLPHSPPQNNHSKMFPASGAKGEMLGEGRGSSLPQAPCQPWPADGSLPSTGTSLAPRLVLEQFFQDMMSSLS